MGKRIDLAAVRAAEARLDRIAAEHPEMLGESTPEEWERILKDQIRPERKRAPQTLRLSDDLLAQVDAYAHALEAELHITVSRSDAIRRLITIGLERENDDREH